LSAVIVTATIDEPRVLTVSIGRQSLIGGAPPLFFARRA
jgi:hypothetical protein